MEVYSRESEGLILALSAQESKQSGKLNSTVTVEEFWSDTSQTLYDSLTSETAVRKTSHPLTSSAAGSPAKTSVMRESEQELTANAAVSGPNTRESFASYDPDSSSWKTSQLCLDGEWSEFSETWPRAGMTRSGKAYELPMLVRHTGENESGLWPTPDANAVNLGEGLETWEARRQRELAKHRNGNGFGTPLTIAVQMWPTPTAEDSQCKGNHPGAVDSLHAAVKLWPTPHGFSKDGKSNGPSGNELGRAVNQAFPTPTANRRDGLQSHGVNVVSGSLNPTWVEWLMGYPLGWTDLEDLETR